MSLDIIANAWRAFKEAIKNLWNDYLDYYSYSGYLFLDPSFEDLFIYQYLLEEEKDRKGID